MGKKKPAGTTDRLVGKVIHFKSDPEAALAGRAKIERVVRNRKTGTVMYVWARRLVNVRGRRSCSGVAFRIGPRSWGGVGLGIFWGGRVRSFKKADRLVAEACAARKPIGVDRPIG